MFYLSHNFPNLLSSSLVYGQGNQHQLRREETAPDIDPQSDLEASCYLELLMRPA